MVQNPIAQALRSAREGLVKALDSHTGNAEKAGENAPEEWRRASEIATVLAQVDPVLQPSEDLEEGLGSLSAEAASEVNAIFLEAVGGGSTKQEPVKKRRGYRKAATKNTGQKASAGRGKGSSTNGKDPAADAIRAILKEHGKGTPNDRVQELLGQPPYNLKPVDGRKIGAIRRVI